MSSESVLYRPQHSQFDELLRPEGELREHWRYPMEVLQSMGVSALQKRQQTAKRILRDDGASYSPGDQLNISHTWQLDLLPMILSSGEWENIENALRERAELLSQHVAPTPLVKLGEQVVEHHRALMDAPLVGRPLHQHRNTCM